MLEKFCKTFYAALQPENAATRFWINYLLLPDILSKYTRIYVGHFNSMLAKKFRNVGTYKRRHIFCSL